MTAPTGSGGGAITEDGCAVEVYLLLPPLGEAELISAAVPAEGSILDLGCGTGRIARGLVDRGHEVVGVDQSAEMLRHAAGFATVQAPIAGLDLGRCFDAVLLASNLLNIPDDTERQAILATAVRHTASGGVVLAQWHPPQWFDIAADGTGGTVGALRIELGDVSRNGDLLSATVRYRAGDELWTQTFTCRRFDDAALRRELREAGLSFERWLTGDRTWLAARPAGSGLRG
jgi:SAM-dependent methyltransferase